jgi:DNA-binding winged helix-turn-helix (wHTH) protein/tetratricopeptide (TPR) repeat protein
MGRERTATWRFDAESGEVYRGHRRVRLSAKPLEVFRVLLARSGRVVSKAELLATAWPEAVVSEWALTTCIHELRQALGDDSRRPRFIETIHRRGYRFIGPIAGKGYDAGDPSMLPEAGSGAGVPLVGRRTELGRLQQAMERARQGLACAVLLSGEAGVGKTRLVEELQADARRAGALALLGQCHESEQVLPYCPWRDVLRPEGPIAQAMSWPSLAPAWRGELARLWPELGAPGPRRALTSTDHLRLFEAVARLVRSLAAPQPVVLIFEDLHWADEMTLRLLAALPRRLSGARALLVGTVRDEERQASTWLPRLLRELRRERLLESILLAPLSRADTWSLARAVAGGRDLPALREERLWAASRGNALIVVETVRALREGTAPTVDSELPVPACVEDLIMARLERLSPHAQGLLDVAAVIGREFDVDLLGRAAAVARPEAARGLEDLVRGRLLSARGDLFDFTHEQIRDVVSRRILPPRRRVLHAGIASALEERHARDPQAVVGALAYHYLEAHLWGKAVPYLIRSAEAATQAYAHAEAARALRQALALVDRLPPEDADRRALEAVVALYVPLLLLGRISESLELLVGHRDRLDRVDDPGLAGRYHYALGCAYVVTGDAERAAEASRRALDEATRCGDRATMGLARQALALASFWPGRYREAIAHGSEAAALLEGTTYAYERGTAHWIVGLSHAFIGEFDLALQAVSVLEAVGDAAGEPRLQSCAAWTAGAVHAWSGETERGVSECTRGLALAPDRVTRAAAAGWLGYAFLEQGDAARAVSLLQKAVTDFAEFGMPHAGGGFACWLAEGHLVAGRLETAEAVAREALATTTDVASPHGIGGAQQALGRVCRARGRLDEAERFYREALETFASCGALFESGRTHLALADLAHRRGARTVAEAHVRKALALFSRLRVPRYVARAVALAGELRGRSPRGIEDPGRRPVPSGPPPGPRLFPVRRSRPAGPDDHRRSVIASVSARRPDGVPSGGRADPPRRKPTTARRPAVRESAPRSGPAGRRSTPAGRRSGRTRYARRPGR